MGTSFTTIYDLFMLEQTDYRLLTLYNNSLTDFNTYLEGFLVFAVGEFEPICVQSLAYSTTTQTFTVTLTQENINILARVLTKYWLQKSITDVLQMQNFVTDRDFSTFSAAQNLKAKQDFYNSKREEISQLLNDYSYRKNDWSGWKTQNFDGS